MGLKAHVLIREYGCLDRIKFSEYITQIIDVVIYFIKHTSSAKGNQFLNCKKDYRIPCLELDLNSASNLSRFNCVKETPV